MHYRHMHTNNVISEKASIKVAVRLKQSQWPVTRLHELFYVQAECLVVFGQQANGKQKAIKMEEHGIGDYSVILINDVSLWNIC